MTGPYLPPGLRPRRSVAPALFGFGFVALFVLHDPLGRLALGSRCVTLGTCLGRFLRAGPAAWATALLVNAAGAGFAYAGAALLTAAIERRVELGARLPWLFAPSDAATRALGVVGGASLLGYLAGTYGAVYTLLGAIALFVLFAPALGGMAVLVAAFPAGSSPALAVAAVAALVGLLALQVAWWFALAHALARGAALGRAAFDSAGGAGR